jgi:hypothetical protein
MALRKERVMALTASLIAGITLSGFVLFASSLIGDVDPNLMKTECPGGKDWDGPGSSCHEGLIVDYVRSPDEATLIEKQQRVVKKRRKVVSWTNKPRDER